MDSSAKQLTEADCLEGIQKSQNILDNAADSQVALRAKARIAIWKRMMFHIQSGSVVTLNADDELHLWERTAGNA